MLPWLKEPMSLELTTEQQKFQYITKLSNDRVLWIFGTILIKTIEAIAEN